MTKQTTMYVGGAVLVLVLVYFLTRPVKVQAASSNTGSSASTANTVFGFLTAATGLATKLIPSGGTGTRPDTPGTGIDYGPGTEDAPRTGSSADNASGTGNDIFAIGTG